MRNGFYSILTNSVTKLIGSPAYLILFVSDSCPNKCSHCWFSADWKGKNLSGDLLTLDEIERLSKSLGHIRFLSITGGEAFLRDDIEEIIKVLLNNAKIDRYDIPTSGFNPDMITSKVENILKNNTKIPFRVDVSLDGTADVHNQIRKNKNSYKNAIETIQNLNRLKRKYSNFDLSIITTVSDANYHEINEIGKLVQEILPDGEWYVNLMRGDTPEINVSDETLTSYIKAQSIIYDRQNRNTFKGDRHNLGKWITAKNSLRRDLIVNIVNGNKKGGGCWAGTMNVVILSNGDVRACELLPDSFGNLRDNDFDLPKMLNSQIGKDIRNKIQQTECICTHECNLSVNIMMQPSCWFDLLKYRVKNS
jgi:MoaA/NifB/PqqE/SkfB family radical SAM enzyme